MFDNPRVGRRNPSGPSCRPADRRASARTTIRWCTAGALLACTCVGQQLEAQATPLRSGVQIRVWSPQVELGEVTGRLRLLSRDTLSLFTNTHGLIHVPLVTVRRIDVNRGRNPAITFGAAGAGAVIGGLLGPVLASEDVRCELGFDDVVDCGRETSDVIIGAASGGIVLWLLSRAATPERWEHVRLDVLIEGLALRIQLRADLSLTFHERTITR